MPVSKMSLFALAALAGSAYAGFAKTVWSVGAPNNAADKIHKLSTTLKVPKLPAEGVLIWPGLYAEGQQLVQTLLINDPAYLKDYCHVDPSKNQWCVQSYQYNSAGKAQGIGPATPVAIGDLLHIVYTYNPATGKTTQTTTHDGSGKQLTSLTWPGGPGYTLSTTIECHANIAGTIPQHMYYNTTIVLEKANPSYNTHVVATDSTPKSFDTTDNGKTWFIPEIVMHESTCKCNPTGLC